MTVATRSDEEIRRDVVDELTWDESVDASDVVVEVSRGEVTLTGTVGDYTSYLSAEEDAWAMPGIRFVRNDLIVKFPAGFAAPADGHIKSNIENLLRWQPNIDSTDIRVSVERGWVTLEGSVDAYWKKVRSEDVTLGITGVAGVSNNLTVVPTKDIEDMAISQDIRDAFLRQGEIDTAMVDIEVDEGKVILSGSVPSLQAFRAAERIARKTLGVRKIDNRLVIQ
jgi:osmotically-inducible protein OsmY